MVDAMSYFLFQPVHYDWCNKGRGMYSSVLLFDDSLNIFFYSTHYIVVRICIRVTAYQADAYTTDPLEHLCFVFKSDIRLKWAY